MKKFIISLILLFMIGCATLPPIADVQKQQTFAFPMIGDINFVGLSPRVFEIQQEISPNRIETISKYSKEIPLVRIVTDKQFRLDSLSVQYFKAGEFYAFKFLERKCRNCGSTDHGHYLYVFDTTFTKEEIKSIIKKFIIIKEKLQQAKLGLLRDI